MDIEEEDWEQIAKMCITRYFHRGGHYQGDFSQRLEGCSLNITIGIAMGFPIVKEGQFSQSDWKLVNEGKRHIFGSSEMKAIQLVAVKIREACGHAKAVYVTVLPIMLYQNRKLYEVPVFRVQSDENSDFQYVDNVGRLYKSFDEWKTNNMLPPCHLMYPCDLRLRKEGCVATSVPVNDNDTVEDKLRYCSQLAGLTVKLTGPTSPLGSLGIGLGAVCSIVSIIHKGTKLWRKSVRESINPFVDPGARKLWLGIAANIGSVLGLGSSVALAVGQAGDNYKHLANLSEVVNKTVETAQWVDSYTELFKGPDKTTVDWVALAFTTLFWKKELYGWKAAYDIVESALNQHKNLGNHAGGVATSSSILGKRKREAKDELEDNCHGTKKTCVLS